MNIIEELKGIYKSNKKILLTIFFTGFFLRLLVIFYLHTYDDPIQLRKTAGDMLDIVDNLVAGKGFQGTVFNTEPRPTSWMAPLYPYFVAFFLIVFKTNGFLIIQIIQAIVSALIPIILFFTGYKIFDQKAGLIAAILAALYPPLIYYSTIIWSAIFLVFLLTIFILFLYYIVESPTWKKMVICGFLLGFTALIDPHIFAFIPFAFLWLFLTLPTSKKDSLKSIAAISFAMFLVISPWTIRNFMVFHGFILVKANAGHAFWVGNNPKATGNMEYVTPDGKELEELRKLNDAERESLFIKKALAFIREDPRRFVSLFFTKLRFFWWKIENKTLGTGNKYANISFYVYGIPLFLSVIGILLSIKKVKQCSLIWLLFLSLSLLFGITAVGLYRYRLPVEPYLLLFTSYTITFLVKRISAH